MHSSMALPPVVSTTRAAYSASVRQRSSVMALAARASQAVWLARHLASRHRSSTVAGCGGPAGVGGGVGVPERAQMKPLFHCMGLYHECPLIGTLHSA